MNDFKELGSETIKKETFRALPIRHIKIGDPSYFEELNTNPKGKYTSNLKRLTCNTEVKLLPYCIVTVKQIKTKYEHNNKPFNISNVEVEIHSAPSQSIMDIYQQGQCLTESIKKQHNLGCDTAHFIMEVDGKHKTFYTGADGSYGNAIFFKKELGMSVYLSFNSGINSYDEVKEAMEYLFEKKEIVG